jgi:raffinose/stachyose/melibiose transport system substrate-binding protein
MKKIFGILLFVMLLAILLPGCAKKTAATGEASNEIMTYKKLTQDKTTLVVSYTGNIDIGAFSEEFERLNPDIQVVCLDITGGNLKVNPAQDWILNGLAPDVMFWSGDLASDQFISENFENLSTGSVMDSYQSEALGDIAIDGNLYCLPCPSEVVCMLYNKTLFEQYGWQVPATFDEFVALCDRITEDTNGEVAPWNPNAKYSNEFQIVMQGFLYDELFSGVDNRKCMMRSLTEQAAQPVT